jgi:Fe2+ transport system protein FeoA
MGVEPGVELRVREVTPIGMFVLEVDGEERNLPEAVADTIRVRSAEVSRP